MKNRNLITMGLVFAFVIIGLVSLIGCDSGSSSPTSPKGTATLQGQILREPNVQLASSSKGVLERIFASLGIDDAWAANNQPVPVSKMQVKLSVNRQFMGSMMTDSDGRSSNQPVPVTNMQVNLSVNGQFMGSMMTDSAGRFRFDGIPSGMYDLMMQDQTGHYNFSHNMNMDMGEMMATYCTVWESGGTTQMNCTHQSGDHWDDMMRGIPGGRWDMDNHRWMMM